MLEVIHEEPVVSDPTRLLVVLDRAIRCGVVPGEHRSWCTDVDDALARLQPAIEGRRRTLEAPLAEMEPRQAERIRHEAERLARRLELLHRRVRGLLGVDARDRGSVENLSSQARLRRDLAIWIALWRLLEGDVDTWIAEAFTRDEGVGG